MANYKSAASPAQRAREYRARKRDAGDKVASGKSNFKNTLWDNGYFVALDGEGESNGEAETFVIKGTGKKYQAKEHIYTLLGSSTGESLYNGGKRLSSQSCLDFLLDLSDAHPKGIFVIFAGSYDTNHILLFGFERELLQKIGRGETTQFEIGDVTYAIEYRARKSLTIRRGLSWKADKKDSKKFRPVWESKITIWDVFGFFQESFVVVMKKWLGENWKHYDLIKRMKLLRGDFANVQQKEINVYNAAELESLVEIMNKVREAINGLDLKCNRWDGAGAVAASILRHHNIREFKQPCEDRVIEAVRCAYAGGRIETCKIGYHVGPVYDYDINSAYPSVMQDLPCLMHGVWKYHKQSVKGFSIVHVKWKLPFDLPFYPFFYRTEKMQISFPSEGEGWYWWPEFSAAYDEYAEFIEVLECWQWQPACNHMPFKFIPEYYNQRQQWIKNPMEDWHYGAEKIIKLGLNSLYGKTAQQLGGKTNKPPTYHQLEWAGYITSATRARLFTAAFLRPQSIIGFATDGIFSTSPLPLEIDKTKKIGAWELKEPVPVGMTTAMAGVYWWHHEHNQYDHFSRGFDKDSMKTPKLIFSAWEKGQSAIDILMHRLIGIGSACTSDTLWKMRGRFCDGYRSLRLDGASHKRQSIDVAKMKPHLGLIDLEPSLNVEYSYELQGCSHPYPIQWLEVEGEDEYETNLELQREISDTNHV